MKAIMISIQPKWVAKILNGEKTIEIRKTCPARFKDLKPYEGAEPIEVYIYCTKDEELFYSRDTQKWYVAKNRKNVKRLSNGVVKAKFTLNRIDRHHVLPTEKMLPFNWNVKQKLNELCLTKEEVMAYGNGEDYQAFLWHIDKLEIFNKPKELSEFRKLGKKCKYQGRDSFCDYCSHCDCIGDKLTKAPQSWCYVEVER